MTWEDRAGVAAARWIKPLLHAMLGTPETAYATYVLARETIAAGIDGVFAECGVFAGVHPAIMMKAAQDCKQTRTVHLFDSFQGIPHAGEKDVDNIAGTLFSHPRDGALVSTGISSCSVAGVKGNLSAWGFNQSGFEFHEGWVQDTLPALPETFGAIAMLRVDVDLYEAVKTCLTHMVPRMAPGAVLIVDDLAMAGSRSAVEEFFPISSFTRINDDSAFRRV